MATPTYRQSTIADRSATVTHTEQRTMGILFLVQFAVFIVALVVLGSAINWPASLDEPASVILPLIREQRSAVALGYSSYFVSALLLAPIALLVYRVLRTGNDAVLTVATGLGVLASFAKLLGISRWLVMMPSLADSYIDPQASAATRDATAVVYNAFNQYAGGIGEGLGVALFSGLWTALVALVVLRQTSPHRTLPRWIGMFGLIAAVLVLVPLVEFYGIGTGPMLIVSGVVWQLWMIALGTLLLVRARTPAL